ncbi:MAG: Crp/Fnr family transcriptional regulator [Lachnospiraceae bacterium]|nr:Crp/Fnr family transcriptional regulator [Lachnospiraceae bacterium]
MNVKKAQAGEVLFPEGAQDHLLSVVADGKVTIENKAGKAVAEKGSILGVPESSAVFYPYTCTAASDVTLYQYDYQSYDDLNGMLTTNQDACGLIACQVAQGFASWIQTYISVLSAAQSLYDTIDEEYAQYKMLCTSLECTPKDLPGLAQLSDLHAKTDIDEWVVDYYASLGSFAPAKWKAFYEKDVKACAGFIIRCGQDLKDLLSSIQAVALHLDMICDLIVSEYKVDLFTFCLELMEDAIAKGAPYAPVSAAIERIINCVEQNPCVDQDLARTRFSEYRNLLPKQKAETSKLKVAGVDEATIEKIKASLQDSLDTILDYAELDGDTCSKFRQLIKNYCAAPDRSSTEDNVRLLRKNLTAGFYEIYKKAFFKSLGDPALPTELKMFFYFGYMDPSLSGIDNAVFLYILAEQITPDPKNMIFTFYEWLRQIYDGRKDPGVNEFNEDYITFLHKQKVEKKITESEEAAALKDGVKRVNYEMDNMFRSVNKIISGRITTFCPVFSDHELYRPLDAMLVKYSAINALIDKIREIDFSCFYREMTYSAPEQGVQKEVIQVEVLPEILLMPGAGARGSMWQEITGKKRTSPARFALPIFLGEDLNKIMVRLCGEFRWELCRRIQGARWNDLGERSLTSDYCDYLETYKRSKDLTPEAKEKIKSSYAKYRNSSKEMFVHDYVDYVLYEGAGSLRLNKLTRVILFTYCPFSKDIREQLSTNQIYKEIVDKYNIKHAHTLHLSDLSMQKIQKSGHPVPQPILDHRAYLEK